MPMEDMFEDQEMVDSFLMEADEIVSGLDDNLIALEHQPNDLDLLNEIFRGFHTLKGMGGFLGFTQLVQVAHESENVLDRLRNQELYVTPQLMDVILSAVDLIKVFLDDIRNKDIKDRDLSQISTDLSALMSGETPTASSGVSDESTPSTTADADVLAWLDSQNGTEEADQPPSSSPATETIEEPTEESKISHDISDSSLEWLQQNKIEPKPEAEPEAPRKLKPEEEIESLSAADLSDLSDIIELENDTPKTSGSKLTEILSETSEEGINLEEIQVSDFSFDAIGEVDDNMTENVMKVQESVNQLMETETSESEVELPSPAADARSKQAEEAVTPQKQIQQRRDVTSSTVRVDVQRLEEMMNLIGELVLERNRLLKLKKDFEGKVDLENFDAELTENSARINLLTTSLQRSILKVRMLPIGSVFKKFPRVARDIARDLKKNIRLVSAGEETELDKTIIDVISEPLTHLIRNSIDHGIETPEVREASGKEAMGTVWLTASHAGNQIIIQIKDDGKGIDPDVITKKALEKGLISESERSYMSKKEILNLIFAPGFSTATEVSKVSGRGVGMDVVHTTVRKFNGTIEVDSAVGQGTKIELRLPLTLAIIQALVVSVGKETFAIPLSSVSETVRVKPHDIQMMKQREVIDLKTRNQVLPLIRLRKVLDCPPLSTNGGKTGDSSYVVVVGIADQHIGVVVDQLIGEEEIVVKPLGSYLGNLSGIAGATIMGDGRVALIMDVSALVGSYGRGR